MEKKVYFKVENDEIIIKITSDENSDNDKECVIKNKTLNAKDIYDLLDFKLGDTYVYEKIEYEGKEKNVLNELEKLLKTITDKISGVNVSDN